jgi:hypothetical protein
VFFPVRPVRAGVDNYKYKKQHTVEGLESIDLNTTGLVGHWKMNEGSGTNVSDSSGEGNHGTLDGDGDEWVDGKVGSGALSFDGTDDYLTVANDASLEISGELTMAFWIKTDKADFQYVFNKLTGGWGWNTGYGVYWHETQGWPRGIVGIGGTGTNFVSVYATVNCSDGKWHFIVFTAEDNDSLKAYVDGALKEETDMTGKTIVTNSIDLLFGSGFDLFLEGALEDVRFYNRSLSVDEIGDLYEWGKSEVAHGYQMFYNVYSGSGDDFGSNVYLDGDSENFPDDIRFVDDDNSTLLDYWIRDYNNSWAGIWVKNNDNLHEDHTVYLYYGYSGASSVSNGTATFEFYDNFTGSLDSDLWDTIQGDVSVDGSDLLFLNGTSGTRGLINSKTTFTIDHAVQSRVKWTTHYADGMYFCGMSQQGEISTYTPRFSLKGYASTSGYADGVFSETANGVARSIAYLGTVSTTSYHNYEGRWLNISGTETTRWYYASLKMYLDVTWRIPNDDEELAVFYYEGGNATQDVVVDWVFVRKCVSPSPYHGAWGEAEKLENKVVLDVPVGTYTESTNYDMLFNYTATFYQGSIENSTVYVYFSNGSLYASQLNTTVITNGTLHTITETISDYGTYDWNVGVWNSTTEIYASENYTFTLNFPSAPDDVVLNGPPDGSNFYLSHNLPQSFTYTPQFDDSYDNASLKINLPNGTWITADTSTSVTNGSVNTLYYTLDYTVTGDYVWNVQVWNSTTGIYGEEDYDFTIHYESEQGAGQGSSEEGQSIEVWHTTDEQDELEESQETEVDYTTDEEEDHDATQNSTITKQQNEQDELNPPVPWCDPQNVIVWSNISTVVTVGNITVANVSILNIECDNWIFAEEKYYLFYAEVTHSGGYDQLWKTKMRFTDGDGWIQVSYDYQNETWTIEEGDDEDTGEKIYLKFGDYSTRGNNTLLVTFPIFLTHNIIDNYDRKIYMYVNDTGGGIFPWQNVTGNYFHIYNIGGKREYATNGSASLVDAGDTFEIRAQNNSWVSVNQTWRKVQHFHSQFAVRFYDVDNAQYEDEFMQDGTHDTGLDVHSSDKGDWVLNVSIYYCIDPDTWVKGWTLQMQMEEGDKGNADNWITLNCTWYQKNTKIKSDLFNAFIEQEPKAQFRIWLDLWFNYVNGSRVAGGRTNAYYFGMENSVGWLGSLFPDWAPIMAKATNATVSTSQSMYFEELLDDEEEVISAKQLDLMKIGFNLSRPTTKSGENDFMVLIKDFDLYEVKTAQGDMVGVNTPILVETKVPDMAQHGFLAPLYAAISKLSQDLVKALGPRVLWAWDIFVSFMDTIAEWAGIPNGFSNLLTWLSTAWSWLTRSFTYLLDFLGPTFTLLDTFSGKMLNTMSTGFGIFGQFATQSFGILDSTRDYGMSLWNLIRLDLWIQLFFILYPVYLLVIWDTKGFDAMLNHINMMLNVFLFFFRIFMGAINLGLAILGRVIESIPVVE